MDQKTCYEYGYDWGKGIASWVDVPDIGTELSPDLDWVGVGTIESEDDQREAMEMLAQEAESNARQFSPFEFMAKELNESEYPDECWELFDEGVSDGIQADIAERMG